MSVYVPTAEQIAHAQAMLTAHGTDAKTHELDATDVDMPVAVLGKLKPSHHFEVSEWGELLTGALRHGNSRARFLLFIRGEHIVARTNQQIDTVAAAIATYADKLRNDLPSAVTITFDQTLAERMAAIVAK